MEKRVPQSSSLLGPSLIIFHIICMFVIINYNCRANFVDKKKTSCVTKKVEGSKKIRTGSLKNIVLNVSRKQIN